MQAFNNKIEFELVQEFVNYWSQTKVGRFIKLIDGTNYLSLRIARSDYSTISKGEGLKVKQGYSTPYGEVSPRTIGFMARVRDQSEDLYMALQELADYSAGDCQGLKVINVRDYLYLHNREDRDRGYRLRQGVFEGEFTNVTGVATQGYINCQGEENRLGDRFGTGFTFKFTEVVPLAIANHTVG